MNTTMPPKRIEIIPSIHGKLTADGKVSEPDVYFILEKWLDRHPQIKRRREDIRVTCGRWTTEDGLETEVISVTIATGDGVASYNAEQDANLYEFWKAEERYRQAE